MNTRLIRYQLRGSTSQYRVLIFSLLDEVDRLRCSESLLKRRVAIAQAAAQIYRSDPGAIKRRAA